MSLYSVHTVLNSISFTEVPFQNINQFDIPYNLFGIAVLAIWNPNESTAFAVGLI